MRQFCPFFDQHLPWGHEGKCRVKFVLVAPINNGSLHWYTSLLLNSLVVHEGEGALLLFTGMGLEFEMIKALL
jgi:hypothetical protein